MALAAELASLGELKANGVLTDKQFECAKDAVIAGGDYTAPAKDPDCAGDDTEENEATSTPDKVGYMRFWSEAFTFLERNPMTVPKDHHLEWREHLAVSKQHDAPALRDGITSTYETEIIFATLVLGVNWSIFVGMVDEEMYAAVRGLNIASTNFWVPVLGFLSIIMAWLSIVNVYLLLVLIAPISDTNLPAFIRSSSVLRCLMAPNICMVWFQSHPIPSPNSNPNPVHQVAMFYATAFFYALMMITASGGAGIMIGLVGVMFGGMFVTLWTFVTPMNVAVNAGCFGDEPAIPPMDLATCTSEEVDYVLRKAALDNVAQFGKAKGMPMFASPPTAFLSHLYSNFARKGPLFKRKRTRNKMGMKKKSIAVHAAIH